MVNDPALRSPRHGFLTTYCNDRNVPPGMRVGSNVRATATAARLIPSKSIGVFIGRIPILRWARRARGKPGGFGGNRHCVEPQPSRHRLDEFGGTVPRALRR